MKDWFKLPSRDEILASRWLRPFAAHLSSPLIWRFNRRGVSRGTALGLFSGFAVPVAQTPFAALFAVGSKANLPVAALMTFITNPFTGPFIYYLAYMTGRFVLQIQAESIMTFSPDQGVIEQTVAKVVSLAGPTYLGLLLFAVVSASLGYFLVDFGWRFWIGHKWRQRKAARRAALQGKAASLQNQPLVDRARPVPQKVSAQGESPASGRLVASGLSNPVSEPGRSTLRTAGRNEVA